MNSMQLKSINVKGTSVVLQIPKFVVKNWGLEVNDFVDMELTEDGNVLLKPRKREVDND